MIEFKNVSKQYATSTKKAVDSFNLRIESGTVCVLLGPSGCGKTTTLRMVNRMIDSDTGEILIDEQNITACAKEELRKKIGYVIQSIGLFPHLNVERNIAVVLKLLRWNKERQRVRVTELLELIGLDPKKYRKKYPHQLSGGEAQRIGVARALAASQHILLMDEPFGAVDPLGRDVLQQEFLALQRKLKKTVIFVTHDLDEAIKIADTIVIMNEGKIIQHDVPEQILANPKNTFIRDFIGEDRALKRLSRFRIKEHMRKPHTVLYTQTATQKPISAVKKHTHWVINQRRQIVGMIKHDNVSPQQILLDAHTFTLRAHHTLRDALSRALGLGINAVPIVDEHAAIIGEILLSDIEDINQRGLKY